MTRLDRHCKRVRRPARRMTGVRVARGLALIAVIAAAGAAPAEPPAAPGDWPQWRGPLRDGVNRETGLLRSWPADKPPVAWEVEHLGLGYSSIVVKQGRLYTQGDLEGIEHVICLDAGTGARVWAVQPAAAAARLERQVADALRRLDANADQQLDEAEALGEMDWRKFCESDKPAEGDRENIGRARARSLFEKLDRDSDGRLTLTEIGPRHSEMFAAIDAADPAGDAAAIANSRTQKLFADFDKDADRRLSAAEARGSFAERLFTSIDSKLEGTDAGDGALTPAETEAYLQKHEPGKDGALTAVELAAYYTEKWGARDGRLTAAELRSVYGGYVDEMGGGPRGTPLVDDGRIYAESCLGDVSCLEAGTGQTLWSVNLKSDFSGRAGRGFCESPLVLGNLLIVSPGGPQGTVVALDKLTGQLVWRSDGATESVHYASPVAAEIAGVPSIVQFASQGLLGLDAASGKLLWRYNRVNSGPANVCTPIVCGDYVFGSSAYSTGGGLVKIVKADAGWKADEVYFEKRMANHHGGIVKVDDYLYGFGTGSLICMNFFTGKIAWMHRSVGKGSLVCADGRLYLVGEAHRVALAEATPEAYRQQGEFAVEDLGRPTWTHPVVAGGRFYIRNQQRLTAYDVADPASGAGGR